MLFGGSLCCISVFLSTMVQTFSAFMFFYAVLFPIGIGIVYWPPIMCAWEWFGERKGLATGLIIGGFGFGAFIFGYISTALANPHDEKRVKDPVSGQMFFAPEVANQVPHMLRICVLIWVCLFLGGTILVSRNPDYVKHESNIRSSLANPEEQESVHNIPVSVKQGVTSR